MDMAPESMMSADELIGSLEALGIDVDPDTADALKRTEQPEMEALTALDAREPGALLRGLMAAGVPLPGDPTEVLEMLEEARAVTEGAPAGGLEPAAHGEGEDASPPAALRGDALLDDPDGAVSKFRKAGGDDDDFIRSYLGCSSLLHILRTASQPEAIRSVFKTMLAPMAGQLCREAGVEGLSAQLLAEAVVEARIDEAHAKALAGVALDSGEFSKAERLERLADRHATRMRKSLDQLHRLRRPAVNVKIGQAANVNLGIQNVATNNGSELEAKSGPDGTDPGPAQ